MSTDAMAEGPRNDAAVVYHGGGTEKYVDEINVLDAPLLMHLDEKRGKGAAARCRSSSPS
jgi:dienelactone hydrolase